MHAHTHTVMGLSGLFLYTICPLLCRTFTKNNRTVIIVANLCSAIWCIWVIRRASLYWARVISQSLTYFMVACPFRILVCTCLLLPETEDNFYAPAAVLKTPCVFNCIYLFAWSLFKFFVCVWPSSLQHCSRPLGRGCTRQDLLALLCPQRSPTMQGHQDSCCSKSVGGTVRLVLLTHTLCPPFHALNVRGHFRPR